MIKNIVAALALNDWFLGDEDVDIAKGKYAMPETWQEYKKQRKRWQNSKKG